MRFLCAGLCLLLISCGKPVQRDAVVSLQDYPGFVSLVQQAGNSSEDARSRATAMALPELAQALSNLDSGVLDARLAADFVAHNPMLEGGREGMLKLTRVENAPRGGAPNLLAGTAHVLVDGQLALIHRVGRMGPLRSINFDVLRIDDDGLLTELWSFLQPLEAGFIDNMLFSFVVPRQLDLIPSANTPQLDLWADMPAYVEPVQESVAQVELNKLLVAAYLEELNSGAASQSITERFLAPDFTIHVNGIDPGREAYAAVLSRANRREGAAERELVLAQNDLVWVLSRIREIREADVPEVASADLFRVRNNKIVEQWRVVQPSPRFSRNVHGLF